MEDRINEIDHHRDRRGGGWFRHSSRREPIVVNQNRRLLIDYMQLKKEPLPLIYVEPLPQNILEWHYVLRGPTETGYEGGLYHGKLVFPQDFPFHPPAIYMITPNGRFRPNFRLCLSISDFHPDTWNPTWSAGTIIQGILSFMLERASTLGSVSTTLNEKKLLALSSYEFNLKDKIFAELFPDLVEEMKKEITTRTEAFATLKEQIDGRRRNPSSALTKYNKYKDYIRRHFMK